MTEQLISNLAIKYFTRAIELNPLNYDIYMNLGRSYSIIGDLENSIRYLNLCLSTNPVAIHCKQLVANHLLWTNDLQNADKYITELEQYINSEKSPERTMPSMYMWTKSLRARYFVKIGKIDQVLSIAQDLSKNPHSIGWRNMIYLELGMAHEVIQLFHERMKINKYAYNYYAMSHNPIYDHVRNDPDFQQFFSQRKTISDETIRKYRIK